MKKLLITLTVALLAAALPLAALTPDEIVAKSQAPEGAASCVAQVAVTMYQVDGSLLHRSADLYTVYENGGAKRLISFSSPASVNGTRLLALVGKDSEVLLHRPGSAKVENLSSAAASQFFLGSDFSYGDLAPHDAALENAALLREESQGGAECYVIESRPKAAAEYSKIVRWISKDGFVVMRADLYGKGASPVKRLVASRIEKVDGVATARVLTMSDLRRGSSTKVEFVDCTFNKTAPAGLFTAAYLEKGSL